MDEETKKKSSIIGILIRSFFLIAITATITYFVTVNITINQYLNKANSAYMTAKMSLVKTKLEDTYIRDLNEDDMIEGAIKGYVSGVGDKYTQYLTTEDMQALMESTTGNYVGIGVYMVTSSEANGVVIVGVIEDSPAEKAGIQAGDIIVKIDDQDFLGKKSDDASNAIKGKEGTTVKMVVKRESEEKEFIIERKTIKVKTVGSQMLDNNVGYIKISSFDIGTASEFKDSYNKLKDQNIKGLILDLRGNGGGVVGEALSIADTMVEKGRTLLITTDKDGKEKIDKASEDPTITVPVIILVNEGTASSSEILAVSLRDNCRYTIIGAKTYGKGVIQSIYTFKDGTGMRVTTNEYFSPTHNIINDVGIEPDIKVELDKEWKGYSSVPFENDKQLQKAIEELNK